MEFLISGLKGEGMAPGRSNFFRMVLPALLVLAVVLGVELLRVGSPPVVRIVPLLPAIGRRTPINIEVSEHTRGLSRIRVELVQGDRTEALADRSYSLPSAFSFWSPASEQDTIRIEVGRETIKGLKAASASIRVTADRAGTWLRRPGPAVETLVLPVRLSPPSIQVLSTKTYVAQGGAEAVVYRVGDTAMHDGVRAGEWWFPGSALPGGGKQDRFAIFAVPCDQTTPQVSLIAADDAGNEAQAGFIDQFFARPPRQDRIELNDSFLNKVVPEIMSHTPDFADRGSLVDNYLAINGDLRRKQDQELKALAGRSRPEFLWRQPFQSVPNAKVMASFAERRSYHYQGREIDRQVHLGYDLAVTRRTPVAAANGGVVVMARYFGIYGNTVIVDHGYGLMTLYGHLSSIGVAEGQTVARGDTLGQTGETGLAGGDHLHYSVLLQGLPINPVEWWDAHWIQDRIARKLGASWNFTAQPATAAK